MKDFKIRGGRTLAVATAGLISLASLGIAAPASAAGVGEIAALEQLGLLDSAQVSDGVDAQARTSTATTDEPSSFIDSGTLVVPSGPAAGELRMAPAVAGSVSELQGVGLQSIDSTHSYAFTAESTGAAANAGYVVIKDEPAPTEYGFDVTYEGEPASLEQLDNGRVVVSDAAGNVVNYFSPAWATDAAGNDVETSYSVEGNTLVQHVAHDGAAYPVVADPASECNGIHCTLFFNKAETKTIKDVGPYGGGVLTAACSAYAGVWGGVACGAYAGVLYTAAVHADNSGDCVGFRSSVIGVGPPHPIIYNDSKCR